MKMFEDVKGKKCRDMVTGFTGTITGHAEYITGCNQFLVSPAVDEKGDYRCAHWFDEQRLTLLDDEGKTVVDNDENNGPGEEAPIK